MNATIKIQFAAEAQAPVAVNVKPAKLSRAEVNRRLGQLSIDPWHNLSGCIAGCHVNAWATGANRRIERVSICAIPKQGGNLVAAFRLAKEVKAKTGLVVHWHGGMVGGVL